MTWVRVPTTCVSVFGGCRGGDGAKGKERSRTAAAFTAILIVAAALLVHRLGSISWTWDESIDVSIVACLEASRDPFRCLDDISQTRLPMYVHSVVAMATPSLSAHYLMSASFALANVVLVFAFARARFGGATALLAMALVSVSPAMLASGRMLMSHANVMLTTFTLAAVAAIDRFERAGNHRFAWLSAVALGLAVATSVLGLFTVLVIAGLWVTGSRRRRLWHPLAYATVAGAVFFLSTIVYVRPANLVALIDATLGPHTYPEWNYLQMGTHLAPRWYSPLLFALRIGPWWAALFAVSPLVLLARGLDHDARRVALVIWAAFLTLLLLKSGVFRYDAPHQQVPWYPLIFVVVSAAVVQAVRRTHALRPLLLGALVVLVSVQVFDVARFFPNYLFYGAQYGERFIGEFYGPAVMHKQDRQSIDHQIDAIIAADVDARVLMADHNAFERASVQFVAFSRRDPSRSYEYALVDRVFATHLRYPGRDEYNDFVARHYTVIASHDFPTQKWAYRILRLRDPERDEPDAATSKRGCSWLLHDWRMSPECPADTGGAEPRAVAKPRLRGDAITRRRGRSGRRRSLLPIDEATTSNEVKPRAAARPAPPNIG